MNGNSGSMQPRLSVVVCTHNPRRSYLTRVLGALRAQTLPKDQWELLVVDNASNEPVTQQHDFSWHPNNRCVLEAEIGIAAARQRGIGRQPIN